MGAVVKPFGGMLGKLRVFMSVAGNRTIRPVATLGESCVSRKPCDAGIFQTIISGALLAVNNLLFRKRTYTMVA